MNVLHLVVASPFGSHSAGDVIRDPADVAAVQWSHPAHVVRVVTWKPDHEPDPDPAPSSLERDPEPETHESEDR